MINSIEDIIQIGLGAAGLKFIQWALSFFYNRHDLLEIRLKQETIELINTLRNERDATAHRLHTLEERLDTIMKEHNDLKEKYAGVKARNITLRTRTTDS